jgi:hypothetical protein
MGAAGRLELTGGVQPIFIKQLKFNPTIWKTCLRLVMEDEAQEICSNYSISGWSFLIFLVYHMKRPNLRYTRILSLKQSERLNDLN